VRPSVDANRRGCLKNLECRKLGQNWGMDDVQATREDRLQGILARLYFCDFCGSEFVNSYRRFFPQSSSGSVGGVLSFRKYCALNGAVIVLNCNGV
jgi:hypothetical protein